MFLHVSTLCVAILTNRPALDHAYDEPERFPPFFPVPSVRFAARTGVQIS
jgi:hypothetical protein